MKRLILLAALLIPVAAHAQFGISDTRQQEVVLHNRSTSSEIVSFTSSMGGIYSNWLAGATWSEVNVIAPGASARFEISCANTPGVYIQETVTNQMEWRNITTQEVSYADDWFNPCDYDDLYLTPEGQVFE